MILHIYSIGFVPTGYQLSKFLRRSLMIFIIKGFQTIAFIFIVISTTRTKKINKDEDNSPKTLNDKNPCKFFIADNYPFISLFHFIFIYLFHSGKKNCLLSSSSSRTISADIPDPISPPFSIIHCFQQVFKATSRIGTELLYVGSSWPSCLCSAMWRGPQEYITYFSNSVPHVWFV